MSELPREWQYLERRPGSSYQQLCVKGKRIWAWTLYCEFMNEKVPRTPQELAEGWGVPLEAVHEAIAYCQSDPPELREDHRQDDLAGDIGRRQNRKNEYAAKIEGLCVGRQRHIRQ